MCFLLQTMVMVHMLAEESDKFWCIAAIIYYEIALTNATLVCIVKRISLCLCTILFRNKCDTVFIQYSLTTFVQRDLKIKILQHLHQSLQKLRNLQTWWYISRRNHRSFRLMEIRLYMLLGIHISFKFLQLCSGRHT